HDESPTGGPDLRAHATVLAGEDRLHRLGGGGARKNGARAAGPGAHAPWVRPQIAVPVLHAGRIRGMPEPEARMLLMDLIEHATQLAFVYTHHWQVGDLVIWDNRCTMHRARTYDETQVRDLHRTTVSDGKPTVVESVAA